MIEKKELIIPLSQPKVGAGGKKGEWKVFKPLIDEKRCIKCQTCWMFCPETAIEIKTRKQVPKINYDWCTGCGICANECPVDAIKMVRKK